MAKYYGMVGYVTFDNETPGISIPVTEERPYYGDILQNYRRLQTTQNLNDDLALTMRISILSDPYALENFHNIRYATYMGTKWKVSTAEVVYPRLILNLGGVYNEAAGPSENPM